MANSAWLPMVGALGGSVVTVLGQAFLTRINQRIQLASEFRKLVNRDWKFQFAKLEEAHRIVARLSAAYSQNAAFIQKEVDSGKTSYHATYIETVETADELQMIADLYFPNLSADVRRLKSGMNLFWGWQNIGLDQIRASGEQTLENFKLVKEAVDEVQTAARLLEDQIRQVAASLHSDRSNILDLQVRP